MGSRLRLRTANKPMSPSELRRRAHSGSGAAAMLLVVIAFRLPGYIGLRVHRRLSFGTPRYQLGFSCMSVLHKIVLVVMS